MPWRREGVSVRTVALAAALVLLTGCGNGAIPSATDTRARDVDLVGSWHLEQAVIDGDRTTVTGDAHVSLAVTPRGVNQAHAGCALVSLRADVVGDEATFTQLGGVGVMICPPTYGPSPIAEDTYFSALTAVNTAHRSSRMLALTGPGVALIYRQVGMG